MSATETRFYVTGGTLPRDAPSYVERQADIDLYEGLSRGDFCYVLHSRQMGKSSLMVRTASRLQQQGAAVVLLDLTAIGRNLTAEQWYGGLLTVLGQHLELEDELDDFWRTHLHLSPLQRWMASLREVVLTRCLGSVVIFVDEIDVVRVLPFDTDEFFAAIRECYNRRTQDPEFARLAFCLSGVASPSDLIQDTRLTPFNIGRRIELTDFTPGEARGLARGIADCGLRIADCERILERILYWTGGHPYLTQRLCRAIVDRLAANPQSAIRNPQSVDPLCEALFLSVQARERDDNLLFVRERLLNSEGDLAGLLELYRKVRRGKGVPPDDTNQLVSILRLSGIARVVEGCLRVRNRIYERVFDQQWVTTHMPDAELRRQRAAYRRGLLRATALSGVIIVVIAGLAFTAVRLAEERRVALVDVSRERDRAMGLLYASQMNLAHQAYREGKIGQAQTILETFRPKPNTRDLRGFEWRYLWRLCRGDDQYTFPRRPGEMTSVSFSPDGKTLAIGASDGAIQLWDTTTKRLLTTLQGHAGTIRSLVFSPDGKTLASGSAEDNVGHLWEVASGRALFTVRGLGYSDDWYAPLAFSADGRTLATGSKGNRSVDLWDVRWLSNTPRPVITPKGKVPLLGPLALSPDGRTLAIAPPDLRSDPAVLLWDIVSKRVTRRLRGHGETATCITFSSDGRTLASGSFDETARLWDVATGREKGLLAGHMGAVDAVAFSPDDKRVASGSWDGTIRLWDVESHARLFTLKGHTNRVGSVAFSPDGKTLASASEDGTARLWETEPERLRQAAHQREEATILTRSTPNNGVWAGGFSPDGRLLTVVRNKVVALWSVSTKREAGRPLTEDRGRFSAVAFAPDGKRVATGSVDGTVRLWDASTRKVIATLPGQTVQVIYLGFCLNGKLLATASLDGSVKLWHVASRRLLATLRKGGPLGDWEPLAVSPDGRTVASVSVDGHITLWDVASQRRVATLQPAVSSFALAFSPDGKTLASGNVDKSVTLWDLPTGRRTLTLTGHAGSVDCLAFSPDGRTLASGSVDHTVKLWNPGIDQEVATLTGHGGLIWSVAFSPDGNLLATGGIDGTMRLWRAATFAETDSEGGHPDADPLGEQEPTSDATQR